MNNQEIESIKKTIAKSILELVSNHILPNSAISGSVRQLGVIYWRYSQYGTHVLDPYFILSENAYLKIQSGEITKKGQLVGDHKIPFKLTLQKLRSATSIEDVQNILENDTMFVGITKEEDSTLNAAGLKASLPTDGSDRYEYAGIKIYPEPVKRKGLFKK